MDGGNFQAKPTRRTQTTGMPADDPPKLQLDGHSQQRRIFTVERIVNYLATLTAANRGKISTSLQGDIYQFGVLTGFGLRAWVDSMRVLNLTLSPEASLYGFDSFDGMPEEGTLYMRSIHKHNSAWHGGGLNTSKLMGVTDWPTLQQRLKRNIGYDPQRTHLIRGFYNESLREGRALARRLGMRPALLIDIDCDLYTSSKQGLSFMLDAGLLVPGSFVYYDDFTIEDWNKDKPPHREERRAHEEVTKEYGLSWRPLNHLVYNGPVKELSWIRQYDIGMKSSGTRRAPQMGKPIKGMLTPVFQLTACKKCSASAERREGLQELLSASV